MSDLLHAVKRTAQLASGLVVAWSTGCVATPAIWSGAAPSAKVDCPSLIQGLDATPYLKLGGREHGEFWSLPLASDLAAPEALRVPAWEGRRLDDLRSDPAARAMIPNDANDVRRRASSLVERLHNRTAEVVATSPLRTRLFTLPNGLIALFYEPSGESLIAPDSPLPRRVVVLPASLPRPASRVLPAAVVATVATPVTLAVDTVYIALIQAPTIAFYTLSGQPDLLAFPWNAPNFDPEPLFPIEEIAQ